MDERNNYNSIHKNIIANKKIEIMSEFKQKVDCSYCGSKDTVTVITKQSKYSRSIQVVKCTFCKVQNGIKEIFNRLK